MMRRLVIALAAVVSTSTVIVPASASGEPRPLGTYTATAFKDETCPATYRCRSFRVACPNVPQPIDGFLGIGAPTASPRGTVVVFSGSRGTTWWSAKELAWAQSLAGLRADGFQVVQVRWRSGWFASSPGDEAGSVALACRPATVLRWVHDRLHLPLDLPPDGLGRCGFCALGWSGGASAAVYALTHYGLGRNLDAVVAVSGPTHGDIAKGCSHVPEDEVYWYTSAVKELDMSYGFLRNGPCALHDRTWTERWLRDGIATSAIDTALPRTRVTIILGAADRGPAPPQSRLVTDLLVAGGSPMISVLTIAGMRHAPNRAGLTALRAELGA
jgi:hypothetical protein